MKKKYIPPRLQVFDIEPRTCIMQYSVENYKDATSKDLGDTTEE